MGNTNCVCHDCKNNCQCETHAAYVVQPNGCENGEHPLNYCTTKEGRNESNATAE